MTEIDLDVLLDQFGVDENLGAGTTSIAEAAEEPRPQVVARSGAAGP